MRCTLFTSFLIIVGSALIPSSLGCRQYQVIILPFIFILNMSLLGVVVFFWFFSVVFGAGTGEAKQ